MLIIENIDLFDEVTHTDAMNNFHTGSHFAKNSISSIQMRSRRVRNKKLRALPTGELQELAPGVGVLVHGLAAAVVPAAIAGTFDAWPKHRRWPRPARVRVAFGEPLDVDGALQPAEIRTRLERDLRRLLTALCAPASDRG
jgi:1-acyl-sn-glycerol-3-phosphate acyltransferase